MSKNVMIIIILLIPVSLWVNFYTYYKYGRSLIPIRRLKREGNRKKR